MSDKKKKDDPALRSNVTKRGGPENEEEKTPEEAVLPKKITEKFGVPKTAKVLME